MTLNREVDQVTKDRKSLAYKVVITGVRGFVGQNLIEHRAFRENYHMTGASRDETFLAGMLDSLDNVCSYDELYLGDERADDEMNYDAYIHLAGKVIHDRQQSDVNEYFEVNFEQTKQVFNRFLEDPRAKKFIFLSTIHVLTEKPDCVIDETYEPKPFTPYGRSKFDAENYIKANSRPDKKFYILRPTMIHGPGNEGNLNMLYNMVNRGVPYILGAVNNCRSFTSIDNLTFIIDELLQGDVESGLYHIADDDPTYSHDLIRMIGEMTGKRARIISVPLPLLRMLAGVGNHINLPINDHRLLKLTEDFIVSNEKIKNAIGKPLPVKSNKGIEKTLRSFIGKN